MFQCVSNKSLISGIVIASCIQSLVPRVGFAFELTPFSGDRVLRGTKTISAFKVKKGKYTAVSSKAAEVARFYESRSNRVFNFNVVNHRNADVEIRYTGSGSCNAGSRIANVGRGSCAKHEVGHVLNLGHAGEATMKFTGYSPSGRTAYADKYSHMSSGAPKGFNAVNFFTFGWLKDDQYGQFQLDDRDFDEVTLYPVRNTDAEGVRVARFIPINPMGEIITKPHLLAIENPAGGKCGNCIRLERAEPGSKRIGGGSTLLAKFGGSPGKRVYFGALGIEVEIVEIIGSSVKVRVYRKVDERVLPCMTYSNDREICEAHMDRCEFKSHKKAGERRHTKCVARLGVHQPTFDEDFVSMLSSVKCSDFNKNNNQCVMRSLICNWNNSKERCSNSPGALEEILADRSI